MKKMIALSFLFISIIAQAQNTGIGTTTPQATLDVKGNYRFGGNSAFMSFDSLEGKMVWANSYIYAPVSMTIMKHSAAADGLLAILLSIQIF